MRAEVGVYECMRWVSSRQSKVGGPDALYQVQVVEGA